MRAQPCRRATCLWQPEYAIEAALLGSFMVSAVAFTVLLEHPASPLRALIESPVLRRTVIGAGMGATAVTLIYSRWGARSGAHMNPAVTLALARLGLVPRRVVIGYVIAQFTGGLAGVGLARLLWGPLVAHETVRYAVTSPAAGVMPAFVAELSMTAGLMSAVLAASRHPVLRPHAGLVAGVLVAAFITVEAPISGMSLNPARTFASAAWAGDFTALWIYFLAPALGMLLAAECDRHRHPLTKDTPCSTMT